MTQSDQQSTEGSGAAIEGTLISVILDRSGSMESIREATIKGFNDFMATQRQEREGGRALVSLTQFDTRFEVNFIGEPIENVPLLDEHSYIPRGGTALNDAIGRTVHELEAWTRAHSWKERVLVLIITDGEENSSQEFSFEAIRALIEQKEKDDWNFVYMGANQDSHAVSAAMSVRGSYSANWDSSVEGVADAYARAGISMKSYRQQGKKGAAAGAFFDDAEKSAPDPRAGKLVPKSGEGKQ